MAKPPMIQKTYRVPVALYERCMKVAEKREENLSDVIRKALEQYAEDRMKAIHLTDPPCGAEPDGEALFVRSPEVVTCPTCSARVSTTS